MSENDPEINLPIRDNSCSVSSALLMPPGDSSQERVILIEIGVVLAMAVLPSLYTSFYDFNFSAVRAPVTVSDDFVSTLLHAAHVIPPLLFIIWRTRERWSSFGIVRVEWLRDILLMFAVFFVDGLSAGCLHRALSTGFPTIAYRLLLSNSRSAGYFWRGPHQPSDYLLLIVTCCLVGFGEELLFRGYLIPRFARIFKSTAKAVVLSTLLFAAGHMYQGWYGVINMILMGLVYALFFVRYRRLWPLAVSHALWDFIIMVRLR